MSQRFATFSLCILCAVGTAAAADDNELGGKSLSVGPCTLTLPDPLATSDERQPTQNDDTVKQPIRFGDKSAEWATFGIGYADNLKGASDYNVRAAWSHFLVQDVEFSVELNAWYFQQPGKNAFGINPAFVFRWHFINTETWTVFADAGIGILLASDVVPQGGTGFDFTPRVGTGFTYKFDEDGDRLQVGLRWHHISNARIEGDAANPSRDGVMLYAGIMFPF